MQNGNAHEEGLAAFWDPIKEYWADGSEEHRRAIAWLPEEESIIWQYTRLALVGCAMAASSSRSPCHRWGALPAPS